MKDMFATDNLSKILDLMEDTAKENYRCNYHNKEISVVKTFLKNFNGLIYHIYFDLSNELDKPILSKLVIKLEEQTDYKTYLAYLELLAKLDLSNLDNVDNKDGLVEYTDDYIKACSKILLELKLEIQSLLYYDIKRRIRKEA